jgi:ABC-2 type transport system ATP-binding protein
LILELGRSGRHTIILSTHILSEVKATCDRIIMIARGRIVADAKIADLEAKHETTLEGVFTRLAMS